MLHNNYNKIFKYIHAFFRSILTLISKVNERANFDFIYNRLSTLMVRCSIIRPPSNLPCTVIILRVSPNETDFPRDKS